MNRDRLAGTPDVYGGGVRICELIQTRIHTKDGREAVVYGIEAASETSCIRIEDITCDMASLSRLMGTILKNDVSILHVRDIVEDFIV